jgi:hypothetical protein
MKVSEVIFYYCREKKNVTPVTSFEKKKTSENWTFKSRCTTGDIIHYIIHILFPPNHLEIIHVYELDLAHIK